MSDNEIHSIVRKYSGKKVLVTGGAGFIGSHICETLSGFCELIVVDNFVSGTKENLKGLKVEIVDADIRTFDFQKRVGRVDTIFHLAANVSLDISIENPYTDADINCLGFLRVLEFARKNQVKRIVYSSSSAVYDPMLELASENIPASPSSPYGVSKLMGEYYLKLYNQLYGMENICLRYFNVFGPRQNPDSPYSGVVSIFMDRMLKNLPITIFGDGYQTRDFVYVLDVVKANLLAGQCLKTNESINIGTGYDVSLRDLVEAISPGYKQLQFGPERLGDARKSCAIIDNAKSILGFSPTYEFKYGIDRYKCWYLEQIGQSSYLGTQNGIFA